MSRWTRNIFVGDLHGCAREFEDLLDIVSYAKGRDRLLLTGDAFSKGPEPVEVWHLIQETRAEMVLGNHDVRLSQHLGKRIRQPDYRPKNEMHRATLDAVGQIADPLFAWLVAQPLWIAHPLFILSHAGVRPGAGLSRTLRDEFLTIRMWPPSNDVSKERWHAHYEPDSKLVVFGHDALGGLVERRVRGKLYALGLDSGCVYGGRLTGYILEEDRILSVQSRQPRVF